MIEEINFETFLYVSKNRYVIFVDDKKNLKNLYKKELKINDQINIDNLSYLSKFLDENVYRIEKLVGNFIKNITLIIENDKILNIDIGIKKKNSKQFLNQNYLKNDLTEVKDLFKENYQDQIIMHMVVICEEDLYLVVKFISISNRIASVFDQLLEKYQIQISQYMSGNYIQNFFNKDVGEFSMMASKLKNGFNENEVTLISKNIGNKGFFEKFFQLFS